MKAALTDRRLKALRGSNGYRDVWDAAVPGFGVRVAPSGRKTFILMARYNKKNPTRRSLGTYGLVSLAEARRRAREWLGLVSEGKDPAIQTRNGSSFKTVAEAFIETKVKHERQAASATRIVRRLIERRGDRPLADITPSDVRVSVFKWFGTI
jgi:hypothetical protein